MSNDEVRNSSSRFQLMNRPPMFGEDTNDFFSLIELRRFILQVNLLSTQRSFCRPLNKLFELFFTKAPGNCHDLLSKHLDAFILFRCELPVAFVTRYKDANFLSIFRIKTPLSFLQFAVLCSFTIGPLSD